MEIQTLDGVARLLTESQLITPLFSPKLCFRFSQWQKEKAKGFEIAVDIMQQAWLAN